MYHTVSLALILYFTYVCTYLGVAFTIDMSILYYKVDLVRSAVTNRRLSIHDLLNVKLITECRTIKEDLVEYSNVLKVVFYNLFKVLPLYTIFVSYLMVHLKDYSWGAPFVLRTEIGNMIVASLISELFFYSVHRYMHLSIWFFRNIHFIHHQHNTNEYSIQSQYCHPVEFILNMVSFSVGVLLMNLHLASVLSLMVYSIIINLMGHTMGDYTIGNLVIYSPAYHQLHHKLRTVNFGMMYVCDYLYGTLMRV